MTKQCGTCIHWGKRMIVHKKLKVCTGRNPLQNEQHYYGILLKYESDGKDCPVYEERKQ